MKFRPTDQQAWEAHASGMTWADVARLMHFANGSVARRAAMRYASAVGAVESTSEPEEAPEEAMPAVKETDREESTPIDPPPVNGALSDLREGDLLYHQLMPKAKFTFVKWNRDGSAQVWGGEQGYHAYHDYRTDDLSRTPNDEVERVVQWATQNVFNEVSVDSLVGLLKVARANAQKAVAGRPDLFRRLGARKFEVRDPKADRAADKAEAL